MPLPNLDEISNGSKTKVQSMQTKFRIMKLAVANIPSVEFKIMNEMVPSLLDSDSMVSLLWQDYFNHYLRVEVRPSEGSEVEAHNMFDLKSTSTGEIPLSRYIELEAEF